MTEIAELVRKATLHHQLLSGQYIALSARMAVRATLQAVIARHKQVAQLQDRVSLTIAEDVPRHITWCVTIAVPQTVFAASADMPHTSIIEQGALSSIWHACSFVRYLCSDAMILRTIVGLAVSRARSSWHAGSVCLPSAHTRWPVEMHASVVTGRLVSPFPLFVCRSRMRWRPAAPGKPAPASLQHKSTFGSFLRHAIRTMR